MINKYNGNESYPTLPKQSLIGNQIERLLHFPISKKKKAVTQNYSNQDFATRIGLHIHQLNRVESLDINLNI
jgi:hypothetical protein